MRNNKLETINEKQERNKQEMRKKKKEDLFGVQSGPVQRADLYHVALWAVLFLCPAFGTIQSRGHITQCESRN